MEAQSTRQTHELKKMQKMIQELTLTVSKIPKPEPLQPRPSLDVECPVCMEVARPPMRLKQCGKGHIICDSCYARGEEEQRRKQPLPYMQGGDHWQAFCSG